MGFIKDGSTDIVQNRTASTSLLLVKHSKEPKIRVVQQVLKYSSQSFIAEVGGVVGIFLGLSFWSLYVILLQPLLNRLTKMALTKPDNKN